MLVKIIGAIILGAGLYYLIVVLNKSACDSRRWNRLVSPSAVFVSALISRYAHGRFPATVPGSSSPRGTASCPRYPQFADPST